MNGYELTQRLRKTRRRHRLSAPTQALYYELVAICNEEEWPDEFKCSNDELCSSLQISEKSLILYRMELIQSRLLFYQSGKSKKKIGTYSFVNEFSNDCKIYSQSGSQSGIQSGSQPVEITSDSNKTKTENETELFIIIGKAEKKITEMRNLFESDVGLKMNWVQKGFAAADFPDGLEQWMIQNNGSKYHDFEKARKHFLFWMPKYQIEIIPNETRNGGNSTNQHVAAKGVKTPGNSDYAGGF